MSYKKDIARYGIDFVAMPTYCPAGQEDFVRQLLDDGDKALSNLYNDLWQQYTSSHGRPFTRRDFSIQRIHAGQNHMLFITLPYSPYTQAMACTRIAITYVEDDGKMADIRMYHVERSAMGTTAIGRMKIDSSGCTAHVNYGDAEKSDDENIRKIWSLAFDDFISIPLNSVPALA